MDRLFTIGLVQHHDLPKQMGHLTSRNFYDVFAVKYLRAKHKNVCAIPFWWWWKVGKKGAEQFEIPKSFIDECIASTYRFVSIPICLISPEAPGGHAGSLLLDKKGKQSSEFIATYGHLIENNLSQIKPGYGTIERFEPHGARAYELFKDYHYETLDEQLAYYFATQYGLEYISPIDYCPALGPQSFEHYINESGYCATWSLWYIDMRLTYPDVDRETLVKGMFNKLHDMLGDNTLEAYLVDYARQVYAVMVADFPHYRDYFINYDVYKKMSKNKPERKAFDKFTKEMENLVSDPLYINKPVKLHAMKIPAPIDSNALQRPVKIPPGKMYKKKAAAKKKPTPKKKKKVTPKKKKPTPKRRRTPNRIPKKSPKRTPRKYSSSPRKYRKYRRYSSSPRRRRNSRH
jgi:hypothetical protein